jgi:hypothetical protein
MRSENCTPSGVTTIFFTARRWARSACVRPVDEAAEIGISAVVPAGCGPRGRIEWM